MKKFFTLAAVIATATVSFAQMHSNMNFIGNAEFYLPSMQAQTQTAIVKDTVKVHMGSDTQTITVPDMVYASMNMTIKSFDIAGLTYTMTGSYQTGDMAFTWSTSDYSTTTTGTDGQEKAVKVTSMSAKYTHTTGELTLSVDFTYGSMPFPLHYEATGYYTTANAWNLVGRGTQGNPYKIYEAADIQAMAANITKDNKGTGEYFKMMNDINFGGTAAAPVQMPAIGKAGAEAIARVNWGFNGTFDGDNHSISGIYHTINTNSTEGKWNALFASVDTLGAISNITFTKDNYVSTYWYAGAIASVCAGSIDNCTNYADITTANGFVTGICGMVIKGSGTIKNCTNYGNLKGMTYACGITGGSQWASTITSFNYVIENCKNYGSMTTTNGVGAAGIAGTFGGDIKNCENYGDINDQDGTAKSRQYTAGIVSCPTYTTLIEGCTNNGSVKGVTKVGGIAGHFMKGDDSNVTISNCVNNGAVNATNDNAGGIVGNTGRVNGIITITNCTNNGEVTADKTETLIGNLRGNAAIVQGEGNTIAAGLKALYLDDANITAISGVNASVLKTVNGTYVKNGQLVIVKGGKQYTTAGVEIK